MYIIKEAIISRRSARRLHKREPHQMRGRQTYRPGGDVMERKISLFVWLSVRASSEHGNKESITTERQTEKWNGKFVNLSSARLELRAPRQCSRRWKGEEMKLIMESMMTWKSIFSCLFRGGAACQHSFEFFVDESSPLETFERFRWSSHAKFYSRDSSRSRRFDLDLRVGNEVHKNWSVMRRDVRCECVRRLIENQTTERDLDGSEKNKLKHQTTTVVASELVSLRSLRGMKKAQRSDWISSPACVRWETSSRRGRIRLRKLPSRH